MTTAIGGQDRSVASLALLRDRRTTTVTASLQQTDPPQTLSTAWFWQVIEPRPAQSGSIEAAMASFARTVSVIDDVVAVTHAIDGNVHLVWTFIHRRNRGLRREVYARELALMNQYPHLLFDFNVVAREQGPNEPLLATDLQGRIVFYRQ